MAITETRQAVGILSLIGAVLSGFSCSGICFWVAVELGSEGGFAHLDPEFDGMTELALLVSWLSVPGLLLSSYSLVSG